MAVAAVHASWRGRAVDLIGRSGPICRIRPITLVRGHVKTPNILFVFADQMRGMDMRCAGNPDILTPAMDRLAREGVMCTRHYATCPICSPNRASMLTGTYATTHRLLFNDTPVRTDLPSLGTLAKAHGYATGYIGKWHLDAGPRDRFTPPGPSRLGFDDFWAAYNCHHDYFDTKYYRDTPELIRRPGYEPELQTDLALEFIRDTHAQQRPFCLVLSWGPPHNSYEFVPEHYKALYDPEKIQLRPNCRPIPREVLDPAWSHRPTTRDYFAQITSLDDNLGRLLTELDRLGIADDTLVIFTSDHGDMMWSQGLLYKCVPFEESVNVPLLLRWPGGALPANRPCASLIGSVDLLPTLAGLLGWEIPAGLEGVNTAPLVRGTVTAAEPDAVLLTFYNTYVFRPDFPVPEWRGLRTPQYTFALRTDRSCWMLYDNERDPYQQHNLATDPDYTTLRSQLAARLEAWLERLGDPFLPGPGMAKAFDVHADYVY